MLAYEAMNLHFAKLKAIAEKPEEWLFDQITEHINSGNLENAIQVDGNKLSPANIAWLRLAGYNVWHVQGSTIDKGTWLVKWESIAFPEITVTNNVTSDSQFDIINKGSLSS